eukprot:gene10472-7277_t
MLQLVGLSYPWFEYALRKQGAVETHTCLMHSSLQPHSSLCTLASSNIHNSAIYIQKKKNLSRKQARHLHRFYSFFFFFLLFGRQLDPSTNKRKNKQRRRDDIDVGTETTTTTKKKTNERTKKSFNLIISINYTSSNALRSYEKCKRKRGNTGCHIHQT